MNMKMGRVAVFVGWGVLLGLGGCATQKQPTFGERLQAQGAQVQALGAQWSQGETLRIKGAKLVKAGDQEVAQGKAIVSGGLDKIAQGEALIAQGNKLKAQSEEKYKTQPEDDYRLRVDPPGGL